MRRTGFVAASLLALAACGPQVPDSAAGVGFGNYSDYAARQAQIKAERNMQLANAATVRPPEATGAPQARSTPTAGVSSAELAAAGIGVSPAATAAAEPVITPAPGSPMATVAGGNNAGISDEQSFAAVSARETIQSDAERLAQQRAQYQTAAPGEVPARPGSTGPDIVAYALETRHPVGQQMYRRTLPSASKAARRCAGYASDDRAQLAFLESGGPVKDRHGIDPDGDGYACGWDPARYRRAVGG